MKLPFQGNPIIHDIPILWQRTFKFIRATQESNVDVNGGYIVGNPAKAPTKADWLMQSLCSAHLEVKHQWLDCF